ncbi:hypothetical protein ACFLU1_05475 [Chloroflexota bacterium]
MSTNSKRAIVYFMGGLGFIFLLLGVIGDVYPTTTGIIIMFGFGLIAGVLAKFWGLKKEKWGADTLYLRIWYMT